MVKALNLFTYILMFKSKCQQSGDNAVTKMPIAAFFVIGAFSLAF